MSHENIIRAWKDEEYRNSLSEEQRSQLPENPAGIVELPDEAMETIAGGGLFSICWGKTKDCIQVEVDIKVTPPKEAKKDVFLPKLL